MPQNKNPFRVQPIRKAPFYLRFLVLVISGSLVFAGVQLAAAALRDPSSTNLSGTQTAPSDTANITAGTPSIPSGAPTGSNSVVPLFSGLNVSGPIFSELSGDASTEVRPLQFYDHVNLWGDLNIVAGKIRNTNSSGSGAVTIDDVLTVTGITTLQGNLQLQNAALADSTDHRVNIVDNLRIQGQNSAGGANDFPTLTLHRASGQVDLVLTTVAESSRRNWKIATGLSSVDSGTGLFVGADLNNDNSYSEGMRLEHVSGSNYKMTMNGDINATNDIFASGKIGHFYRMHRDAVPPSSGGGTYLEVEASCYSGDTRIGCTAFQDGTTSQLKGAWPSSARSCEAKSVRNGNNNTNEELHLWAFCFSPDGQQPFTGVTRTNKTYGTVLTGITIDGITYSSTSESDGLMVQGYTEGNDDVILPGNGWTDPAPPGEF